MNPARTPYGILAAMLKAIPGLIRWSYNPLSLGRRETSSDSASRQNGAC